MIWALLVGLVVGAVAKFVMPGKQPGGIFITMLLGVAGAILANWIGQSTGVYGENEAAGFIGSVVGAMIILVIYRMIVGRKA